VNPSMKGNFELIFASRIEGRAQTRNTLGKGGKAMIGDDMDRLIMQTLGSNGFVAVDWQFTAWT
jgi:hypothetical protein